MKIREPRIMQHAGTNSKKEIKEGSKTYKVCYEVWEVFALQTIVLEGLVIFTQKAQPTQGILTR